MVAIHAMPPTDSAICAAVRAADVPGAAADEDDTADVVVEWVALEEDCHLLQAEGLGAFVYGDGPGDHWELSWDDAPAFCKSDGEPMPLNSAKAAALSAWLDEMGRHARRAFEALGQGSTLAEEGER